MRPGGRRYHRQMPCTSRSLPVILALLAACGDDSVGLEPQTTDADTSTGDPATTTAGTSTGAIVPTTGDPSEGSDSLSASTGDTSTGEPDPTTSTSTTDATTTSTSSTTDASTTTGDPAPVCGDGMLDPPELCDDGDDSNNNACKPDCTPNVCGDGALHDGVEVCDDGNLDDTDFCSATCETQVCGDNIVQPGPGEQCDDGNNTAEDGCSETCTLEICGDNILHPGLGETCDDGNLLSGDGCDATCKLEPVSLCAPGTISVLANEGFEDGVFPPWTSNGGGTTVVMQNVHEGLWAAETLGNFHVQQNFPAVPVPQLTAASFWTWHSATDSPAMSVEWGYSDNTTGATFYGNNQLQNWQPHDLLALLAPGKSLVWLRVWGYSGGGPEPDITHFDEFRLCRKP